MSTSFWNFPKSCKYDVLVEERHIHLIHGALCDPQTRIENLENHDFLVYGDEEALLIKKPTSAPLRLALYLYSALLSLSHR